MTNIFCQLLWNGKQNVSEAWKIIKLELLLQYLTDSAVIGTVEKLFSAAMV